MNALVLLCLTASVAVLVPSVAADRIDIGSNPCWESDLCHIDCGMYGRKIGQIGCPICKCNEAHVDENGCKVKMCQFRCDQYKKDNKGCTMCECVRPYTGDSVESIRLM